MGMSGTVQDKTMESVTRSTHDSGNSDVKPLVVTPRRDPKVWFDSIRTGAAPRPKALVDLSK